MVMVAFTIVLAWCITPWMVGILIHLWNGWREVWWSCCRPFWSRMMTGIVQAWLSSIVVVSTAGTELVVAFASGSYNKILISGSSTQSFFHAGMIFKAQTALLKAGKHEVGLQRRLTHTQEMTRKDSPISIFILWCTLSNTFLFLLLLV